MPVEWRIWRAFRVHLCTGMFVIRRWSYGLWQVVTPSFIWPQRVTSRALSATRPPSFAQTFSVRKRSYPPRSNVALSVWFICPPTRFLVLPWTARLAGPIRRCVRAIPMPRVRWAQKRLSLHGAIHLDPTLLSCDAPTIMGRGNISKKPSRAGQWQRAQVVPCPYMVPAWPVETGSMLRIVRGASSIV